MKIYEVKKNRGKETEYYAHDWSSEETTRYYKIFVKGKGYVKILKNNTSVLDIEAKVPWTYAEIRRLWDTYGKHVAYQYCCDNLTCAEICVPVYMVIAKNCRDPEMLDIIKEKTGFDVYKGSYMMTAYGLFCFPILEFDDHLHKEHGYDEDTHGSMQSFVTDKWGEDFAERMENLWAKTSSKKQSQSSTGNSQSTTMGATCRKPAKA